MRNKEKQRLIRQVVVAVAFMISTYSFAQPPGGGQGEQKGPPPIPNHEQVDAMVKDVSNELLLSSTQEEKVHDLFTSHFEEVREKTSGDNRPDRNEMEALKLSFENDLQKVLSSDQFADIQVYMQKKKLKRH